jgi:transcriptional enhancer factor
VFWRFNTTNQWYKYNPVFKPAGTSWRWLTVNDPMSRYHQQKALVYPSASMSRDSIMSPTPSINQHMTAAMNETFNSAWDPSASLAQVPNIATTNNGLTLFESFSGGLATPPPTAGLQGSYPGSFDHGMPPSTGVGFIPSTCSTAGESHPVAGHGHSHSQAAYYDAQTTLADLKPVLSTANPFQSPTKHQDWICQTLLSMTIQSATLVFKAGICRRWTGGLQAQAAVQNGDLIIRSSPAVIKQLYGHNHIGNTLREVIVTIALDQ